MKDQNDIYHFIRGATVKYTQINHLLRKVMRTTIYAIRFSSGIKFYLPYLYLVHVTVIVIAIHVTSALKVIICIYVNHLFMLFLPLLPLLIFLLFLLPSQFINTAVDMQSILQ